MSEPTISVSQPNVQQLKIDALSSIATLKIAVDDPSIADFIMHRVKTWVNAELAERDRELQQAREELPATFYADRNLPFRLRMMVVAWQRAINAYSEVDKSLSEAREELARLKEALAKLVSYNEDIRDGKINYRPEDHIAVAKYALEPCEIVYHKHPDCRMNHHPANQRSMCSCACHQTRDADRCPTCGSKEKRHIQSELHQTECHNSWHEFDKDCLDCIEKVDHTKHNYGE